jgi:hypothetical protein
VREFSLPPPWLYLPALSWHNANQGSNRRPLIDPAKPSIPGPDTRVLASLPTRPKPPIPGAARSIDWMLTVTRGVGEVSGLSISRPVRPMNTSPCCAASSAAPSLSSWRRPARRPRPGPARRTRRPGRWPPRRCAGPPPMTSGSAVANSQVLFAMRHRRRAAAPSGSLTAAITNARRASRAGESNRVSPAGGRCRRRCSCATP